MKRILCALALVTVSTSSFSATTGQGKVTVLQAGSHMSIPYVLVTIEPAPVFTSGCATAGETRLLFDGSTPAGQLMMSLAISAKAAGQTIEYRGYGSCYTDVSQNWTWEKLDWIRVK